MRHLSICLLSVAMLSAGCQSAGTSAGRADDPPAMTAGDRQASFSYSPRAVGIDDDREFTRPGAVQQVVLAPMRGVGAVFGELFEVPRRSMQYASGDTPGRAARMMRDKQSADNRRMGINDLMRFDYAIKSRYTAAAFEAMARTDEDPTVRAAALRACNRCRDRAATPVFIKALADKSEWVRLEGAKGLANVPDAEAATPLMRAATNPEESPDVRIAAADALKYYRTPEVARSLCTMLGDSDFGVAWQARRSLVYLTGRNFGYDQGAWLGYFAGPGKPLG